ncbi:hypothetical protein LRP88_13382 [Fusarium phalaenopsidis]
MSTIRITPRDMLSDTNTTEKRAPGSLISKPSDLSAEEKLMAFDLIQAWCKDHRGDSKPLDSGRTVAREPSLPKQTDDDTFIEIGIVLSDQESFFDQESISDQETVADKSAERAYLGLTINPGDRSITWSFKGEEGPIDPSLVHYVFYEDKAGAYRACIANYDDSEIRRV